MSWAIVLLASYELKIKLTGCYTLDCSKTLEWSCPSPDSSGNPFVPGFGTKDCFASSLALGCNG